MSKDFENSSGNVVWSRRRSDRRLVKASYFLNLLLVCVIIRIGFIFHDYRFPEAKALLDGNDGLNAVLGPLTPQEEGFV